MTKHIERSNDTHCVFDNRSLQQDYAPLRSALKPGLTVLDIGCGTGAISKDVAQIVGPQGKVVGIDNTEKFIESGKASYGHVDNLTLQAVDLFDYTPDFSFDLVMAARVLQWLDKPIEALKKIKTLLKPNGVVSILDYNHEALEWEPSPPASMQAFYRIFLQWRADAGLNNRMAEDLKSCMEAAGFSHISVNEANEHYLRDNKHFLTKVGIWSHVASSKQMVEEGYLDDTLRLQAIAEYDAWVKDECISMTMHLSEVRGRNNNS